MSKVKLAERSKAMGLSPITFMCVGSNPTLDNFFNRESISKDKKTILVYIHTFLFDDVHCHE